MLAPLLASALLFAPAPLVPAPQDVVLETQPARWRVLFGELDVPGEDLGLLGLHYDVLEPLPRLPEFYFGLGGWAAMTGDRGGLFTGGFTTGFLKELGPQWWLDAGLFFGGGGGGGGATNDGFMLRPHIGVERTFGLYGVRLELSNTDISGTDINDFNVSLGVSLLSEALYAKKGRRAGNVPEDALLERPLRVTARTTRFSPSNSSRRANGQKLSADVTMLGVGLDYFLTPNWFIPLEAMGAVGGGIDGYAQATAGLGFSIPVTSAIDFEAKASLGSGGGGGTDTKGGLLWVAQAGLRSTIWSGVGVELTGGYLDSPGGAFGGTVLSGAISWGMELTELHPAYPRHALAGQAISRRKAKIARPAFEVLHKFYKPPGDARKKDGSSYEGNISLLGVGVAWPVNDWLELTGRAFGAYDGGLGGYAEGFFGGRYTLRPLEDRRHSFTALAQVGAGGGGGADVGSGLLYEFTVGYRYRVHERATLFIEAGKLESNQGTFEAESWTLGLAWDLGLPVLR